MDVKRLASPVAAIAVMVAAASAAGPRSAGAASQRNDAITPTAQALKRVVIVVLDQVRASNGPKGAC